MEPISARDQVGARKPVAPAPATGQAETLPKRETRRVPMMRCEHGFVAGRNLRPDHDRLILDSALPMVNLARRRWSEQRPCPVPSSCLEVLTSTLRPLAPSGRTRAVHHFRSATLPT